MKNNPNKSLKRSIAKHINCIIRRTLRKEEISRGIIRLSQKTLWFPFVWENLKKRNTKDPWHFPRFVPLVLGIQSKNIRQRRRRDRHGTGNRNGRQIPVYKTQKAAAFEVCRFQSKPFRRPFFRTTRWIDAGGTRAIDLWNDAGANESFECETRPPIAAGHEKGSL